MALGMGIAGWYPGAVRAIWGQILAGAKGKGGTRHQSPGRGPSYLCTILATRKRGDQSSIGEWEATGPVNLQILSPLFL